MNEEENIFQRYMDDVSKYELLSQEKEKEPKTIKPKLGLRPKI